MSSGGGTNWLRCRLRNWHRRTRHVYVCRWVLIANVEDLRTLPRRSLWSSWRGYTRSLWRSWRKYGRDEARDTEAMCALEVFELLGALSYLVQVVIVRKLHELVKLGIVRHSREEEGERLPDPASPVPGKSDASTATCSFCFIMA